MADVLIRGMVMPENWRDCPFSNGAAGCKLQSNIVCAKVYEAHDCPLVALPEEHGDLIDRNALPWEEQELNDFGDWSLKVKLIENAPTIVPAEKEDVE